MKIMLQRVAVLTACLTTVIIASGRQMRTFAGISSDAMSSRHFDRPVTKAGSSWDQKAASAYLDQRQAWWMNWPRAQRDHQTFCISCHTAVPYALSRPLLDQGVGESGPSPNERRLLENIVRRVRLWKEVAPFYTDADHGPYKTVESRGTESVLNALVLAFRDGQKGQLTADTQLAFDNMWSEQQTTGTNKGAWRWLRFNNQPWEANDSDFYGATLAAVAVGTAPGDYRATPAIQGNIKILREYLNRESASQTVLNRVGLLWAAAKVPGLIDPDRQKAIVAELLQRQQSDGGWSLASLVGDWKRSDGTSQQQTSDGYTTGIIVFALQQAGIASANNKQLKRGIAWLIANQDKTNGSWPGYSLNKNQEHHISPETALFMRDAATSYAVLALETEANRR